MKKVIIGTNLIVSAIANDIEVSPLKRCLPM